MAETYLVVGLGNPGSKYEHTRHNLGYMIVDNLARQLKTALDNQLPDYVTGKTEFEAKNLVLAKPLTFMNRSGEAVVELVEDLHLPLSNLLVVVDDFNLPFGKIRLRKAGSDGGHNGLASIIYHLQSHDFPRLRVGIDNGEFRDAVTHVLSDFSQEERQKLPEIIDLATEACFGFITEGIEKSMSKYNQKQTNLN